MTALPCRLTGRAHAPFHRFPAIALANKPAAKAEPAAVAPMDLVFDAVSGHVSAHLALAEPLEALLGRIYGTAYEGKTPTDLSPTQAAWNDFVAARVAEALPTGARVLEIGAFDGSFLVRLRDRGLRVQGVEPSPVAALAEERGLAVHRRLFRAADFGAERFDAVVIRHVLEHVPAPAAFLAEAASVLAPGGLAYVEVPNSLWSLSACYLPEFHVDHLSYFTPASLGACLRMAGLSRVQALEAVQGPMRFPFLCALARPAVGETGAAAPAAAFQDFAMPAILHRFTAAFAACRMALAAVARAGGLALWGSGAVATQYAIDGGFPAAIPCVDPNPRNPGKVLAVTGNPVLPPAALRELRPATLLIASAWEEDVRRQVAPFVAAGTRVLGYDALLAEGFALLAAAERREAA